MHHNYCIIKKFIYQIGNSEVRNKQEQTGTDRNRQELTGLYIWLLHHKEIHLSDRKSRNKEQTGIDRNRQDYISDIENYCIIIIA